MTDNKKYKVLKTAQNYPWLSSIYGLIFVGYLMSLILKPEYTIIFNTLDSVLEKYSFLISPQFLLSIFTVFVLVIVLGLIIISFSI